MCRWYIAIPSQSRTLIIALTHSLSLLIFRSKASSLLTFFLSHDLSLLLCLSHAIFSLSLSFSYLALPCSLTHSPTSLSLSFSLSLPTAYNVDNVDSVRSLLRRTRPKVPRANLVFQIKISGKPISCKNDVSLRANNSLGTLLVLATSLTNSDFFHVSRRTRTVDKNVGNVASGEQHHQLGRRRRVRVLRRHRRRDVHLRRDLVLVKPELFILMRWTSSEFIFTICFPLSLFPWACLNI